jgi:acetoacetate decarboxylase
MSFVTTRAQAEAGEIKTVVFDDVDMLVLAWRTDPIIIARVLPPPLKPAAAPVVVAFIANFKSTNYNPPYHEAGLYVRAQHEGVEGGYCASMLLDDDIAMMIGREMHGYPKKLARLGLSVNDAKVSAHIERRGVRIIDAELDLTAPTHDPMAALAQLAGPTYTFRFSPAVEGRGMDGPVRLVESSAAAEPREVLAGSPRVALTPSEFDPWAELAVEEIIGAAFVRGAVSVPRNGGRVVATVPPETFAPYAYGAWDRPFHNFFENGQPAT